MILPPSLTPLIPCDVTRRAEPRESGELPCGNSDLHSLESADPDTYRCGADPGFVEAAVAKLAHRFPGLPEAAVSSGYAGCYDVTPDINPIISTTDAP